MSDRLMSMLGELDPARELVVDDEARTSAQARALELARSDGASVRGLWRLRTRRLSVVVAVAVLAAVSIPAYAVGRSLGLLGDAAPFPPGVEGFLEKAHDSGVPGSRPLPGSLRQVLEIRNARGDRAAIYAAPTRDGGVCWYVGDGPEVEFGGMGFSGTCFEKDDLPGRDRPLRLDFFARMGRSREERLNPERQFIAGFVAPHVASAEIEFADGTATPVRIVRQFFLYDVPRERYGRGVRPVAVVLRDDAGKELRRAEFCGGPPFPQPTMLCPDG